MAHGGRPLPAQTASMLDSCIATGSSPIRSDGTAADENRSFERAGTAPTACYIPLAKLLCEWPKPAACKQLMA